MHKEGDAFWQRNRNTATIQIGNSQYTLVYGTHNKPHLEEEFPPRFDALFLEVGRGGNYIKSPINTIDRLITGADNYTGANLAAKQKKPIYLVDPYTDLKTPLLELAVVGVEMMLGGLPGNLLPGDSLLLDVANFGIRMWLLENYLPRLAYEFSYRTGLGYDFSAFLNSARRVIHPELLNLTEVARSKLIAHKERWLNEYLGNDQHFVSVLGNAHSAVEGDFLKGPEDRLKSLKRRRWLLKTLSPETVFSIQRFDYIDEEWQPTETLEVPDLKELLAGK